MKLIKIRVHLLSPLGFKGFFFRPRHVLKRWKRYCPNERYKSDLAFFSRLNSLAARDPRALRPPFPFSFLFFPPFLLFFFFVFINQLHLSQSRGWMSLEGRTLVSVALFFFLPLPPAWPNICLYPTRKKGLVSGSRQKGVGRLLKKKEKKPFGLKHRHLFSPPLLATTRDH